MIVKHQQHQESGEQLPQLFPKKQEECNTNSLYTKIVARVALNAEVRGARMNEVSMRNSKGWCPPPLFEMSSGSSASKVSLNMTMPPEGATADRPNQLYSTLQMMKGGATQLG